MNRKALLCMVTVFFWFSLYAYIPQMTNYAREMGASYQMIGLIAGAYGLSQTILRIPLGMASDMLGKRKIFVSVGLLITILSALLVYLYPNVHTLLFGRLIAGFAAATWVNFTVMFSGYFKDDQATQAMGIINSASKLGQFLAMLLGGLISLKYGNRSLFLLSVVGGSIGFILSTIVKEDRSELESKAFQFSDLRKLMKSRYIMHISLLGMVSQLINYSTTFGFTPLIAANLGANNLELGLLTTVFNLPQIIFAVLSGTVLVKYFGEKVTLLVGFGINALVSIMTPFIPNLTMLFLFQILNGIGNAISFPLLMGLVIKSVEKQMRTTTMGFYQAVYGVGMMFGPILLGSIGDIYGLKTGFMVTGLLGVVAFGSLFALKTEEIPNSMQRA